VHPIDIAIVVLYFTGMLGVGFYFRAKQDSLDEYFVGGRKMSAGHIGFSVVATDVGGGFSIGLGGLGFMLGLSASWLLFSGLLGAWLAAVLLVPKVKALGEKHQFRTFPDLLANRYGESVRILAALVSAIGYAGFTGSQLLAGGKLTAAAFGLNVVPAVLIMAVVIIVYTALGGLEAVVYTDTVQWAILLFGLTFLALPLGYMAVGGWSGLTAAMPAEMLTLGNVGWKQFGTWMITIVPIWFVAMTLHQRIHACRDVKTARRAWLLAGLLEWPAMAFIGAVLGLFAQVLFPELGPDQSEMGLPMVIRDVLPVAARGIVIAAYLAAIMSTADSCLLASVGNLIGDIYQRHLRPGRHAQSASAAADEGSTLWLSRVLTLIVGFGSVAFALTVPKVIDSILLAYAFMVSGLLFPTIAALYWRRVTARAAFWSILAGGVTAVVLSTPWITPPFGLDPAFFGLPASGIVLLGVTFLTRPNPA
jgi:SSS family solute:Na+ symporter